MAQLTDPHICPPGKLLSDVVDTAAHLRDAVAHLSELEVAPDLVVATGDLTDAGSPAEYEHLIELLAPLPMPYVVLPGNHDDTDNLAAVIAPPHALAQAGVGWQYVVDAGPLRVIALDTRVPGEPGGRLGPQRLAWLDFVLGESDAPTIVALHHPPFVTGIQHMDTMGLADSDALGDVIEAYPHIVRVISGHLHRSITCGWRGTVVTTCPSTAHQVALDLAPGQAHWRREPPAVQLHVWLRDSQSLVTHTSYVGDYGPSEPFG